ncbi:aminoacyl-tRNA hydrolase [Schleiferilactobacillus perolens]|uniref:aminoacyl-tRNA hydrolase n=1 Tax=Schleiferilactobacillus perolens TaxID=100468 RepID=UPI00070C780C
MKLIVGLGNPGSKYARTKHNIGFMAADRLLDEMSNTQQHQQFEAETWSGLLNGEKVIVAKPLTYMNDSGRAVGPLLHYYKLTLDDLLVIQDDLDMPVGKVRIRTHGASGGHNGIKSIIRAVGGDAFPRIKVGIDHPPVGTVVDWVLTPFVGDNAVAVAAALDDVAKAATDWAGGASPADLMNTYN